ncbi:hypothetical protein ID866_6735 [Astraeus odoratus]|nr:hypothetical protein ID866_6735 [Astraeus odoratus]
MGAVRACYLLLLLPFLLATFKPVRAVIASAMRPQADPCAPKTKSPPSISQLFAEMRFDLRVVRASMLVDFCSHAAVVLAPLPSLDPSSSWWSEVYFVAATSLGCASAGVMPAVQSFALSTLQGRALAEKEAARVRAGSNATTNDHDVEPAPGKLLGAVAVLQAIGSTILGPVVFGVIYSNTVASFPKAIFVVAACLILLSITLTFFIKPAGGVAKPKKNKGTVYASSKHARRRYEEETRGRSRVSKDLRGGAAGAWYGTTGTHHTGLSTQPGGSGLAGPSGSHASVTDPVTISAEDTTPSPSTCSASAVDHTLEQPTPLDLILPTELDPLLVPTRAKKPFYRARPLWLVPFVLISAIAHGMILASRLEVFIEVSCNQLHGPYDRTSIAHGTTNKAILLSTYGFAQSLIHPHFPPPASLVDRPQDDGVSEGGHAPVMPGEKCVSDPAVQASAAQLQVIIATTMGALSALTTIHSRKLLILAVVVEGLLGGWSTMMSAKTAYIADCTPPGSRATIFSRFSGILYLYAQHVYSWTAEKLSYYISLMGVVPACYLLLILRSLLSRFKPVHDVNTSAERPQIDPSMPKTKTKSKPALSISQLFRDAFRSLRSARLDVAGWSEVLFVAAMSLACAEAGVMPAAESFALSTLQGRALAKKEAADNHAGPSVVANDHDTETTPGKLLGSLAVVQAVGTAIFGRHGGFVPQAAFVVAAGLIMFSIIVTFYIEPTGGMPKFEKSGTATGPVYVSSSKKVKRRYEEETRRRSHVSRDLRGAAADGSCSYDATIEDNSYHSMIASQSGSGPSGPSSSRTETDPKLSVSEAIAS